MTKSQLAKTLPNLKPGESVLAPFSDMKSSSQMTLVSQYNRYTERQYTVRNIDEQHNRIWRVK
jgi:NADPH-dependent ferric siderophore reductase